jgi:chemotaxis protein MotB
VATVKPIIVIKKKGGHGGHHGGAWKVAYADFVTAMMALFIVLWLLNTSEKVQKAVGGYFRDPSGTAKLAGSEMQGAEENFVITKDNMEDLKEQLQKTIREVPVFDKLKNNIDMTVTNEGLRIELTETAAGTFFDSGSAKISGDGSELVVALAEELGKLPNTLAMEGHTDSKPYSGRGTYGNWELSSDRANAARRLMTQHGIRPDQVTQVRGFADQRLRKKDAPLDPSNRRISLIVQYLKKAPGQGSEKSDAEGEPGEEGKPGAESKPAAEGKGAPEGKGAAEGKAPEQKAPAKNSKAPTESPKK